jgi:uncharacterized membrane protein YqjE
LRIARPILLVSTPIGVLFGLREAWRLAGPKMALLMAAMLTVVGLLVWWTVRRIREESALERARLESEANEHCSIGRPCS